MKRNLAIGFMLLVLAVMVTVLVYLAGLGDRVKEAVEKYGSAAAQVSVTLAEAKVKPAEGSAVLSGLAVGKAFELDRIVIKIDAATITKDLVIVNEVVMQGPLVTHERGENGGNIGIIGKNAERFAGGGAGRKFIIEHLYARGGTLTIAANAPGSKSITVPLPEIHLTDIGKARGGAGAAEIAAEIVAALAGRIAEFVAGLDTGGAPDDAANSLKKPAGK